MSILETLQTALPAWDFEPYGSNGAIACFPPQGRPCFEAWKALERHAVISAVCGPLYVVAQLRVASVTDCGVLS